MRKFFVLLLPFLFLLVATSLGAQEFSSDLKQKIEAYRTERETIRNELVAKVNQNIHATREEKSRAVKEWREQNAGRIAEQRKLAKEIHERLRESIREKYKQIKDLPEEESNKIMQEWYAENSLYLSVIGESKSMEIAKNEFRQEAKERAKLHKLENRSDKAVKAKPETGNNGNGNNGNNGKGKAKGKNK